MGLLDDAIREHMELKRLRGADPGALAREEQEALGPVHHEDGAVAAEHPAASTETALEDGGLEDDDSARTQHQAHGQDFANFGQETAELDMRTVLGGEVLGEEHDAHRAASAARAVSDVLEETPGFPRETPEQERL